MKLKAGKECYLSRTDSKGTITKCTLYSIVTKELASSEEKIYSVVQPGGSPFSCHLDNIHSSKEEALQAIAKANGITISILKDPNET